MLIDLSLDNFTLLENAIQHKYKDESSYIKNCYFLLEHHPSLFIEVMLNALEDTTNKQFFINFFNNLNSKDLSLFYNHLQTCDVNHLTPYTDDLLSLLFSKLPTKEKYFDVIIRLSLFKKIDTNFLNKIEILFKKAFDNNSINRETIKYFFEYLFKKYLVNPEVFKKSVIWKNESLKNKFYFNLTFASIPIKSINIPKNGYNLIALTFFEFLTAQGTDSDYKKWLETNKLSLFTFSSSFFETLNQSNQDAFFEFIIQHKPPTENNEIKPKFLKLFKTFLGNDFFGDKDDDLIANLNDDQKVFNYNSSYSSYFKRLPCDIKEYNKIICSFVLDKIKLDEINSDTKYLVPLCEWLVTHAEKDLSDDYWYSIKTLCLKAFNVENGFDTLMPMIEMKAKILNQLDLIKIIYVNQIQEKIPTNYQEWNRLPLYYKAISFYNLTEKQQEHLIELSNQKLNAKEIWSNSLENYLKDYLYLLETNSDLKINPMLLLTIQVCECYKKRNKFDIEKIKEDHQVTIPFTASAVVTKTLTLEEAIELNHYIEGVKSLGIKQQEMVTIATFFYEKMLTSMNKNNDIHLLKSTDLNLSI